MTAAGNYPVYYPTDVANFYPFTLFSSFAWMSLFILWILNSILFSVIHLLTFVRINKIITNKNKQTKFQSSSLLKD